MAVNTVIPASGRVTGRNRRHDAGGHRQLATWHAGSVPVRAERGKKERDRHVGRLLARISGSRRGVAFVTVLVMADGLAAYGGMAGAAPRPTVAQVQARINQLTTQVDKVTEQLDQASQQLSAAQSKLVQVRVHLNHANARFRAARGGVARNAAAAFEDTGATSIAGVLTSGDPSVILRQGSLLMELSGNQNAQTRQLLSAATQLAGVYQQMQTTE